MIKRVQAAVQTLSTAEIEDAKQVLSRYSPEQVEESITYMNKHANKPSWAYLRRVLMAKKRRITMADYATFDETTKAKLDKYVFCPGLQGVVLTGLETEEELAGRPEWVKKAYREG